MSRSDTIFHSVDMWTDQYLGVSTRYRHVSILARSKMRLETLSSALKIKTLNDAPIIWLLCSKFGDACCTVCCIKRNSMAAAQWVAKMDINHLIRQQKGFHSINRTKENLWKGGYSKWLENWAVISYLYLNKSEHEKARICHNFSL